jgi:hypothetical protein
MPISTAEGTFWMWRDLPGRLGRIVLGGNGGPGGPLHDYGQRLAVSSADVQSHTTGDSQSMP